MSLEPQVRQFSGVPRAVFEACSARPPVDLPFQAAWLVAEAAYPPLRGQTDASRYDPAGTGRHWSPVTRGSARRDRAASAVAARVCVLHPVATTAPDPHSKTPLEAPLVDRGNRPV